MASPLPQDRGVNHRPETPFDSIESSHEYVGLLLEAIDEARETIELERSQAAAVAATRREQALRIVAFKLEKLRAHVDSSHRILNDLRTLRRLLLAERGAAPARARLERDPAEEEGA
jgi:hypothetical protein